MQLTIFLSYYPDVIFKGKTNLARISLDKDTGGRAIVSKGADEVEVEFSNEYEIVLVVTISMIADKVENETVEGLPNAIVTDTNTTGFSIVLSESAKKDIQFFWMALSIREMETTVSLEGETESEKETTDSEEPSFAEVAEGKPFSAEAVSLKEASGLGEENC